MQQIWKIQQWNGIGKCQFSFQSLKKAMSKNFSTSEQLHSFHMLTKECSKFSNQQYVNQELPDVHVEFRKGKGTRDKIANISRIIKKRHKNSRKKTPPSALLTKLKPLTVCIINELGKMFKELEIPDHLTCLLRNLYVDQEATVKSQTWNNGLFPNWERNTSRLYIVTLLI